MFLLILTVSAYKDNIITGRGHFKILKSKFGEAHGGAHDAVPAAGGTG